MSKFYITTSIAYVNGEPHIGFAMELLEADCIARYKRAMGEDVFFLTGTDEHGSKIVETAEKLGLTPQQLCDKNSQKFLDLTTLLHCTNNDFIRTTDQKRHWPAVHKLWKKLEAEGDIYKAKYEGLYCVGCEKFILEKELVNGKCPHHDRVPEKLSEENYFFRLSRYSKQIGEIIRSKKLSILPEFRANEILNVIEEGLQDVSFSRPRTALNWGIPVPGDDSQVMYVWCDALTNYISAIGYAEETKTFHEYWSNCTHVIGKDIVRFHAAIWIGMLLSAKLELPKRELIHGWVNMKGERMSKSKGNVISPFDLTQKYGVDAVRYYLLSEIPTGKDGDFTYERFEERYSADLANNLGNLLHRVTAMLHKYCGGVAENIDQKAVDQFTGKYLKKYHEQMEGMVLDSAAKTAWELVDAGNKFIEEQAPWTLVKNGKQDEAKKVLGILAGVLAHIAAMVQPFIPLAAEEMAKRLGIKADNFDGIPKAIAKNIRIEQGTPLFSKLETKE